MDLQSTVGATQENIVTEWIPARGRLELQMRLRSEMVTTIRTFIELLYAQLLDGETLYRVGLAVHELMDNAVRCAVVDDVKMIVEVDDKMVTVHTENRAQANDIASVERTLAEMRDQSDPFAYYLELMERSARKKNISGLGLGRIWAEADMTLSYESTAGVVSIRAQRPIAGHGV